MVVDIGSTDRTEGRLRAMSKKHYVRIAKVIAALEDRATAKIIAEELASMFKADNGNFSFDTFYTACGVR